MITSRSYTAILEKKLFIYLSITIYNTTEKHIHNNKTDTSTLLSGTFLNEISK
jgi:hypothetical protein